MMVDKSNQKAATMWSNKPVRMKLFGAWEIDKTPPDCIPRLCLLNINRLTWTRAIRQDVTSIILAVKMQNSKRILRSNEISIPSHSDSTSPLEIELDLSFTLQYPHFLKRNCNYLQIILQRRKKYKNKAILGFKTLACGVLNMSEVLQRPTIVERDLDLIGHVKESSNDVTIAQITISSLKSQPIDQDNNLRRGKVSIDRPDMYSDDDEFTSAEDGSDSETIESNTRDRFNQFRRKVNSRKPRKPFVSGDKFRAVDPSNVQQRNLKQKFISLLKKFQKMPDSEVYDSEEKFQEALEQELMSSNQEPADMDEFFDDDEIDDLDDLSDSGQEFDDVSISSTPKPSLRPFFSSCTLVGQDNPDELQLMQSKKIDSDSQENSGTEHTPDTSDTSQKHNQSDEINKKKISLDKEAKRMKHKNSKFAKDKENKAPTKEKKQPGNAPSISSSTPNKEDNSTPKELSLEQLNKIFIGDEYNIPDEIVFINMSECAHGSAVLQAFERTHHVVTTNSMADVKYCFHFLSGKIQKFCNSNYKTPISIKLALIGSDSYVNAFLRAYVELLSTKSPEWQSYLRFYVVPSFYYSSTHSYLSSLLPKYLARIDPVYSSFFNTNQAKEFDTTRLESSTEVTQFAQELYTKVCNYLKSAHSLLQIPIAEAMVTYKDKNMDDESTQVFIPFVCDAKIGPVESLYGNHSLEIEDNPASVSPPGQISQLTHGNDKSITSPLSGKEQHSTISLTPPNSPSISSNQTSFGQSSCSKEHKDKEKEKDKDKESVLHGNEALDLQIDYWTVQPRVNDAFGRKSDKLTLKNCFRNLQISRLPTVGVSVSTLTLIYVTKEKRQKIMRLGKKKEKENESKSQTVENICRLVCSYNKTTQSPIKVIIDGVELSGVKFFQLTTQWQTQIKSFPLAIFNTPDPSLSINAAGPFNTSSSNVPKVARG